MTHWYMMLSLIFRIIPIYEQNSLWRILAQWKLLLASRWYSAWSVSLFICYYFADFPKYLHVFYSISMVCIVLSMVCVVFVCFADIYSITRSLIPLQSELSSEPEADGIHYQYQCFSDILRGFPPHSALILINY